MSVFPTLSMLPDQTTWTEQKEDPAISTSMEGGDVLTRARFTRAPRKTFRFNYTNLSNADKDLWDAFWDTVKGGSDAFTYSHPFNGNIYTMRFVTKTFGQPPEVKYANFSFLADGVTKDHRWNINGIEVQEV